MATRARTNTGCWTCRVRKKKCDERKEQCSTCDSLNLVCHGYGQRPDWMDGGTREKDKANEFKAVVSRLNKRRRRKGSDTLACPQDHEAFNQTALVTLNHDIMSAMNEVRHTSQSIDTTPVLESNIGLSLTSDSIMSPYSIDLSSINNLNPHSAKGGNRQDVSTHEVSRADSFWLSPPTSLNTPNDLGNFYPTWNGYGGWGDQSTNEMGLTQAALSISLSSPALLAAQEPPLFSSGSQPARTTNTEEYMLDILQSLTPYESNAICYYIDAMFQVIFPFVTSEDAQSISTQLLHITRESETCQASLLAQTILYQQLQLGRFGLGSSSFEDISLSYEMAAIGGLHKLLHDSHSTDTNARNENIGLEIQICTTHILLSQMSRTDYNCTVLIERLGSFIPESLDSTYGERRLFLSFYQKALVTLEVLSCTFTGAEPKFAITSMQKYNSKQASEDLTIAVGIENWLVSCLISSIMLRRWKEVQVSQGSLSMAELVKKAILIEKDLVLHREQNFLKIKTQTYQDRWIFTNIFACATTIFLHTIISEPRPQIEEIKQGVTETIEAIQLLRRPDHLKRLAWPVCIAACLADSSQQQFFRNLSIMVDEAFGKDENITKALAVAKECWKLRERGGRDTDVAPSWEDGMRSLGNMLLLY